MQVVGCTSEDCTGGGLGQPAETSQGRGSHWALGKVRRLFSKLGMAMLRFIMLDLKEAIVADMKKWHLEQSRGREWLIAGLSHAWYKLV